MRLLELSRTEPAKTILIVVCVISILMVLFTLTPWFGPPEAIRLGITQAPTLLSKLPSVLITTGICSWGIWAAWKNNLKHMTRAAFWVQFIWSFSALTRLVLTTLPGQLLWVPFVIVSLIMAIVYLYLAHENRKVGTDE